MTSYQFPAGFLWGAATSSHQVEGGNRWNDWWEHEEAGRLPYRSADACCHWERYEEDFELARVWGHNAHRLSIEWSRVEPEPGVWNEEALAHYRRVIEALKRRGLEPLVTLHHFTNPRWFARRGGWERRDSPQLLVRYVQRTAAVLGADVRYWLTINEPTVYIKRAYVAGDWPPSPDLRGEKPSWSCGISCGPTAPCTDSSAGRGGTAWWASPTARRSSFPAIPDVGATESRRPCRISPSTVCSSSCSGRGPAGWGAPAISISSA